MKTTISVLFLVLAATKAFQNIRQPKEIAQRRQGVSYSNNVLHENPNFPDQTAESSVKVNFNTQQIEPRKPVFPQYQQEYQPFTQNYPTNSPQSQLFNVGYSVSFTNGQKLAEPPKFTRNNNLDDGEIITGTRKQNEEVQGPGLNMSPQEYVTTALISTKKQKISGIKAKPQLITNYPHPKVLLSQANLSPNTQKYYKTLEQLKPQVQNNQELQQRYTWRNLSPGVEIIRSTEIPSPQKLPRSEPEPHFDHGRALGGSQEFDYTNGIDSNSPPQQNTLFYNNIQPQAQPQQQTPIVVQNVQKFPIDMTFLKEPIPPIPVDTRYMEEQLRSNQLALYKSKYSQFPEANEEVNYLQQNYRTIPVHESTQTKPVQVIYRQEQPQVFQEFPREQSRYQLKIYGKPQPIGDPFNDRQEDHVKRQPRYLTDLRTNLRPPPFGLAYQRRVRVVRN